MGFIEEGRQLLQDFVTPEIRAIEVRLDAVEKQVAALDAKMDKRFDAADKRFDSLEAKMERNQAQVIDEIRRMENYAAMMERLARLESKLQNVA
jgi:tetrahydromethanopterin S-methyltransferase subunit G